VSEITLHKRYGITADISHCEALNRDWVSNFVSPAAHKLSRFRCFIA